MTLDTKKKIKFGGLGALMFLMIAYMAYDVLGEAETPPIISSVETPSELDFMIEPVASRPAPLFDVPETTNEPVHLSAEPVDLVITYQSSQKAKDVLDALETTYISQVNKNKLAAQIAEQAEKQTLDSMQLKPVIETPVSEPVITRSSIIDLITVKSVVITPTRTTAWLNINGGDIPVQYGVWVEDLRVVNITKDFVRFNNKNGQGFTKYVPSTASLTAQHKGK